MRTAIIVSDSKNHCKSLQLMASMSNNIKILDSAIDKELGLVMVMENRPELLFIRLDQQWGQIGSFINRVKAESPNTKCIVIIPRFDEFSNATNSGADEILEKGFTIAELNCLLQRLYLS